jgi:ATP-dependent exoDNAse (exonuclease V) beta subunit
VAEGQEAEEGQPPEGTEDAVRILTIHGAKGLGFEHVYLLQLHSQSATGTGPPTRLGGGAYSREYRLLGAPSLGFDQVERADGATEAAERVRLLYVAVTRAKRRLVLMGNWSLRQAPAPEQARSLMDLLGHRRPLPDLEALPQRLDSPAGSAAETSSDSGPPAVEIAGARWVFPALANPRTDEAEAAPPESLAVDEERALGDALKLRELRRQARQRSSRPWDATPSGAAAESKNEAAEEFFATTEPAGPRRSVATAVGQVVHRMLEDLDLSRPVQQSLAEQELRAPALLASEVEAARLEEGEEALAELLEVFSSGPLPSRLEEIRGGILARELPILLAPGEQDPALGSISGVVDLLYRDPRNGQTVIADYKTDRISSTEAVAARARHYHPQGELYRRAVQGAFQLPALPRFELWFLRAGQIVEVTASEIAPGSG